MKRILFYVLGLIVFSALPVHAQKSVFLFEQFMNVKIKMKPRGVTVVKANYDAANKRLMYQQGTDMMEMTNTNNVDTVFVGERKLVPAPKGFYEVVSVPNGNVLIDWYLRDVEIGKKGALGTTTSGSVHALQMGDLGLSASEMYTAYQHQDGTSNNVYRRRSDNIYLVKHNGKSYKFKSLKQIIKAFPKHSSAIQEFVKENDLDMKQVEDALQIINYVLGI